MHESRIVIDLVRQAEMQAVVAGGAVVAIKLRIGALSAVGVEALRHGVSEATVTRWGWCPDLDIDQSTDLTDANALGVTLESIKVIS